MLSQVDLFLKNIEKKDKTISYLKNIYRIEVGEEAVIPRRYIDDENLADSNNLKNTEKEEQQESEKVNNLEYQKDYISFEEKVESLNLPSINDKNAKLKIAKLKKMKDNKFLINHLDLSYYADKGINLTLFKNVVEGIKILKSVQDLNLKNNNLDDNYSDIICELFSIESLKRINLSNNNLTKLTAKKLTNSIKNSSKLEYLDLSFNPFNLDEYSCSTICLALKSHPNLFHFGLCDSTRDSAVKFLLFKNDMKSILLDDSRYKAKTFEYFTKILQDKKFNLAILSLRYTNIDLFCAAAIEKGLKLNKSLVYLNLYSSGISDIAASRIISSLEYNQSLIELDLGANNLAGVFCKSFSRVLKLNSHLQKVNLSKNFKIIDKDFSDILEGLVNNQSIISLGDLEDSKIGVKIRESAETILELNKKFLSEARTIIIGLENEESKIKEDKNKISLYNLSLSSLNMSQKMNFLKSSIDFEGQEKIKRENLDICDIKNRENNDDQEVLKLANLVNTYSIKLYEEGRNNESDQVIDFFIF
jgi:hypothetical protein